MSSAHACGHRCDSDLHFSEIVVLGSINRELAQRYLRRIHGRPALFVEALYDSGGATTERRVDLRHNVTQISRGSGLRPVPPPAMVWIAAWRQ